MSFKSRKTISDVESLLKNIFVVSPLLEFVARSHAVGELHGSSSVNDSAEVVHKNKITKHFTFIIVFVLRQNINN